MSPCRVLGVIPARGSSKRILCKNIRPLCGRPLIAYTIEAAAASERLTTWVVSTDDEAIRDVALSYGAYVIRRPDELATDDATTGHVLLHSLEWMEPDAFDLVVCLHPTSPIRDPRHIDQAIDMLWRSDAPGLASVECRKRSYTHNASIYVMRADWLVATGQHHSEQFIPFLMDKSHSIDIDDEMDWKVAECLLRKT